MRLTKQYSMPHFLDALKKLNIPHEVVQHDLAVTFLVPPIQFAKRFGHKQVEKVQRIKVPAVKIGEDVWPLKRSTNDVANQRQTENKNFQVMLNAILAGLGDQDEA